LTQGKNRALRIGDGRAPETWRIMGLQQHVCTECQCLRRGRISLRSTFRPEAARGVHVRYEPHLGEIIVSARVANGEVAVTAGPLPAADLLIEAGPGIKGLMAGEISAGDAIERGIVRITGEAELLAHFTRMFRIDPMPSPKN
jgi:hypothetical protein